MHNSIRARSRLLSSPPPASLSPRLASRTHVREDTPLARMSPSRSCAKVTRASSRARATRRRRVVPALAHRGRTRACTTTHGTICMFTTNQRSVFPSTVVCLSAHDPPRPRRDIAPCGRSPRVVTRSRVPPRPDPTPGRDAGRLGRLGRPCARCGPRRGRRPSRRLSRRRRPSSGTCRSEPSVARDRDRERREGREGRRGDARGR